MDETRYPGNFNDRGWREDLQNDIEKAAKDRKDEINSQMKDDLKSLKEEAKGLKSEAKDSYKEYKDYKKDSGDPRADHKISQAKDISNAIKKDIDKDYGDTKETIKEEAENRINSIDNMLDTSGEDDRRGKDDTVIDNSDTDYKARRTNTDYVEREVYARSRPDLDLGKDILI